MMQTVKRLLRNKKAWAFLAVLVLLYTILGFLVAPKIIHRQMVSAVTENLGRRCSLQAVRFNPFLLSLTLRGFVLEEPDGAEAVTFDELYVNFQVSSLFRWAYTFKEVRLDNPRAHVRLMPNGRTSFADIVDRQAQKPPSAEAKPPSIPRLVIGDLQVNGARLYATNLSAPEPEAVAFTPVNFRLFEFTTIPRRDGDYTLGAIGQDGGRWEWQGKLTFEPLRASGTFALSGSQLRRVWEVIKNRVNFEIASGEMGLRLDYNVEIRGDSAFVAVRNASVSLDGFALREKGASPDLFTLDSLRVSGVQMDYPAQTASIGRIALSGGQVAAWLDETGKVNWLSVFPPPTAKADSVAHEAQAPPSGPATSPPHPVWAVRVGEIRLERFAAHFEDRTTEPDFVLDVSPIDVGLRNLRSDPDSTFDIEVDMTIAERGVLRVEGRAGILPPMANVAVSLTDLPLPIFQPYVNPMAKLRLVSGNLGVRGHVQFREGESADTPDIRFQGAFDSRDLLTQDTMKNERFIAWKRLAIDRISYDTKHLDIAEIVATQPYGRIIIHEDRTTNLADVLAPPGGDTTRAPAAPTEAEATKKAPTPSTPIPTTVGEIRIVDGSADFADLSLVLPFAAGLESLNGDIKGLSSERLARADVTLDGSVQPNGGVAVRGQINPLSGDLYTDIGVAFRDFDLPVLTPYSGQYIGREIGKGKLFLDLKYRVENRQLVGENKIVLDQLELGDDVESPDATSLPVGLGIALLKDREGKIDLDVPVEGNLDDPKFSIWDAVKDIIVNIFTKAITAPFALLGKLVGFGGGEDELSYVSYPPGMSTLSAPEHDKILKLGEALNERPQLRLDVRGRTNPEVDAAVMRQAKFDELVATRVATDPKKYTPPTGIRYAPRLLRDLYVERLGKDATKALEQKFQVPEIGKDGKPKEKMVLDEPAFYAEIQTALVALQPIDDTELRTLALERSQAIKTVLVTQGQVTDTRIFLVDVDNEGEAKDGAVRMELKLTD
jgi:hypothetical protein